MHSTEINKEFSLDEFMSRLQLKKHSLSELVSAISPQIYSNLRLAIEIGKWPDGGLLNNNQKESCMQLVILYEADHIPEIERVGFNLPVGCSKENGTKGAEISQVSDRKPRAEGAPHAESESNPKESEL
jgi:uncharacterized protein YeaC (DUF1315 family)